MIIVRLMEIGITLAVLQLRIGDGVVRGLKCLRESPISEDADHNILSFLDIETAICGPKN